MIAFHIGFKDFFITPFYLILLCLIVYMVSRRIKDKQIRRYFIQGAYLKFFGAITFGLIYAFFYPGGDTTSYWKYGVVIGDTFWTSPSIWFKLIIHAPMDNDLYPYLSKLPWFYDASSSIPCQIVGLFAPFCFNTYSVIALFFALISFNGIWHLFLVLNSLYPNLHKKTALSIFYLPSLFFWGSGIMKDPLVLAGLGWFTYAFYFGLVKRERPLKCTILGIISVYLLFGVKPYVIGCFFPPMVIWLYLLYIKNIKNLVVKTLFTFLAVVLSIGFLSLFANLLESSTGYKFNDLNSVTQRIEITNRWIQSVTREEGSSYDLGENDGTVAGNLALAPQAIFTSLFRPFIWEIRNVVALLAAIESSWIFIVTLIVLIKVGIFRTVKIILADPTIMFCLLFSIILSFIVGISSGNFGTLVRYKIPMIPFYISAMYAILQTRAKQKEEMAVKKASQIHPALQTAKPSLA
jgi:hypothetical protein